MVLLYVEKSVLKVVAVQTILSLITMHILQAQLLDGWDL